MVNEDEFYDLPAAQPVAAWIGGKRALAARGGCEDNFGKLLFDRDQFTRMGDCLKRLREAFILPLNDLPETREVFQSFDLTGVELAYTLTTAGSRPVKEMSVRVLDDFVA